MRAIYASSGDISRAIPFFSNILSFFIGKTVVVESERLTVKGKLVGFKEGSKEGHLPLILILENGDGKHILRAWNIIKERVML